MNIIDPKVLSRYLQDKGQLLPGEEIAVRELSGGVSCLTLLVQRTAGPDLVIKKARPKLKVREAWFSDPKRIHIEAAAMSALQEILPPDSVPRLLFEDEKHHLLGMEAVPQPHDNWKTLLLQGKLDLEHVEQFAQNLAAIHRLSLQNARYHNKFVNRYFFITLRLEPYYTFVAEQLPEAAPFLQELIKDTLVESLTLVHGDYSPKNILVHQNRLILLDHEVMHFGDGAFDIGFSMTHLLSKARHMRPFRSEFRQAALHYWAIYQKHFILPPGWEERAVRHTIACMLARVRGKSPLEYLSEEEKNAQARRCLELIGRQPAGMEELIEEAAA